MKFQTSITDIKNGEEVIRGHNLQDLVHQYTFVETIFLLAQKRMPSKDEARMLDAILMSVVDHGPGVASAMTARISASAKNPMHSSVAAGLLSFGDRHGMAVEGGMKFLKEQVILSKEQEEYSIEVEVKKRKEAKVLIPGYGHKLFTDVDPRAETLFALAKDLGIFGQHCEFAHDVHTALNAMSSRPLPINVDGAIAPILCDMGFETTWGNGIFLIGRLPGLVAHIVEEIEQGNGIRRLDQSDIEFLG